MDWNIKGDETMGMKVYYKNGKILQGAGEGLSNSTEDRGKISGTFIKNDKILAEEGLAIVAQKVLESRKESLKLNESAAIINNLVKRIRRTIESRCEQLKKDIDLSAEEAYSILNKILNEFCEEGKKFKYSIESFNLVMKRCRAFIEKFKSTEMQDKDSCDESDLDASRGGYTDHLLQILATLTKSKIPTFDFNMSLSFEPNNTPLGEYPLGKLVCGNEIEEEPKEKVEPEENGKTENLKKTSSSHEMVAPSVTKQANTFFTNIKDLTYWRSVECVSGDMRPLGLVSLLTLSSSNKSQKTIKSSKSSISGVDPLLESPFKETDRIPSNDLKFSSLQRCYLLLSSSAEMEIFNENLNQLVRCVKVESIKDPIDIISWNEWVAISNDQNEWIHVASMLTKTVSKFPIPGGCGKLSVDNEGKITITCKSNNYIILFDVKTNKILRVKLPSTIVKPIHAIHAEESTKAQFSNSKMDGDELFVVCQADTQHRVCVLNREGEILCSFGGSKGEGKYQLNKPEYLMADKQGNVIVCDSGNCRLLVLDPALKLIKEISLRPLDVGKPTKLFIDHEKQLMFITDVFNKSIVVTRYTLRP